VRSNIDLIEWRNCGPGNNSSLKFWACEGWFGSNETGLQCQAGFEKYVISSQPLKKQSRWSGEKQVDLQPVERIMFSTGFARKVRVFEKIAHAKAQRRKALPRFKGFLCAFAPLREKSSPYRYGTDSLCKAFSTNCHLADIHDFRCAVSSRYSGLKVT